MFSVGHSQTSNVFMFTVGFHKGQNAKFNLINNKLATRWLVERWRSVRKKTTPVIGQIKLLVKCLGISASEIYVSALT